MRSLTRPRPHRYPGPPFTLGGGSNLPAVDAGYPGPFIRTATTGITTRSVGAVEVTTAAGEPLERLVAHLALQDPPRTVDHPVPYSAPDPQPVALRLWPIDTRRSTFARHPAALSPLVAAGGHPQFSDASNRVANAQLEQRNSRWR